MSDIDQASADLAAAVTRWADRAVLSRSRDGRRRQMGKHLADWRDDPRDVALARLYAIMLRPFARFVRAITRELE